MTTIEELHTIPERDVYHGGSAVTDTCLWLDPDGRRCGVHQWRDDYANADYWNGILIQESVSDENNETPDAEPLRAYLESPEAQALLDRVCDGWEQDGERGITDDDSDEAWQELIDHITHKIPSTAWTVWDVDEWFNGEENVHGTETDEEIQALADEAEALVQDDQIINGRIYDYLIEKRDECRTELETE